MNRDEAIRGLRSSSMHERLQAARFFVKHATAADYEAISSALALESVVWVRTALQAAQQTSGGGIAIRTVSSKVWDDVEPEDEAYAKAVEHTTRRLVHEIEPIVGVLRLSASLEVQDFEKSRTARALGRLVETLSAMSVLGRAAAVPQVREFDLAELVRTVADSESTRRATKVELAGAAPLICASDPAILSIVIANAIRNAIEATASANSKGSFVIVNWGSTPGEYWISVIDEGVGLPLSASRVYEIGTTTKAEHLGMGLAVCYRAARTLGGHIELSQRDRSGARFEFRWPRPFTVQR